MLALIRLTLSTIPVDLLISISLPPWLCKALKKIMVAFLWTRTDVVRGESVWWHGTECSTHCTRGGSVCRTSDCRASL
jgi:hypothetical protein